MKKLGVARLILPPDLEQGTSGIASASQLVESTSSYSIEFGTSPYPTIAGSFKNKTVETREETVQEKLYKIARSHKDTLDKLDDA